MASALMNEMMQFLLNHDYAVLFVWVLADQAGVPLPAVPILLAAGVLVENGFLTFPWAFGIAVSACLISNVFWYFIGRSQGVSVLSMLCRISLNLIRPSWPQSPSSLP